MIASTLVLLSFTLGHASAAGAPGAPLDPVAYGAARDAAEQAHAQAIADIDNRQELIRNQYGQTLQQAQQQLAAERARIAARLVDLNAVAVLEAADIKAQRDEAHARMRDTPGLYRALPDANPGVPVDPTAVIAPGVVDRLAERNAEHARLEAQRLANQIAGVNRQLAAIDAEIHVALPQFYGQQARERLEALRRNRAEIVDAHERALVDLATRSRRYEEQVARANADAAHAALAARPVPTGRQAADDLLAALQQ